MRDGSTRFATPNLNMVLGEGWMIVLCQILNLGGGEISRRCVEETQIVSLITREGGRSVQGVIFCFGQIIG